MNLPGSLETAGYFVHLHDITSGISCFYGDKSLATRFENLVSFEPVKHIFWKKITSCYISFGGNDKFFAILLLHMCFVKFLSSLHAWQALLE